MTLVLAGPVGGPDVEGSPHPFGGPHHAAGLHEAPLHPERPQRIDAVMQGVADLHLGSDLELVEPVRPSHDDLSRAHTDAYLHELEGFARRGGGQLDPDTYVTQGSWEAAQAAAGAGLAAVEALRRRGEGVGFAVARPPGHHAEAGRGMGFCLLNNVAIVAAALASQGERVAVVDWDVHHGNGTQEIFWDDPRVLYVSTHQWPLYPGTGRPSEVGGARALGATLNVPVPPGATGDVLRTAFDDLVSPTVEAFAPSWVLVSCGFDAHRSDPLASLELTAGDFGALALCVAALVPSGGRLVLFLEGGYDLRAVRRSTAATVAALLGDPAAADLGAGGGPEAPSSGGPGIAALHADALARSRAIEAAGEAKG